MPGNVMTLGELLAEGKRRLRESGYPREELSLDAFRMLSLLTRMTHPQYVAHANDDAPPPVAEDFLKMIQRRTQGEPLQYLLGEWEFYGLPMEVGPGVLIPRPETEELAEQTLRFLAPIPSPAVLDLCSGSGCIPIAIAHSRPDAAVWGAELSGEAYEYFVKNIARNRVKNITPVLSDVFALPGEITRRRYHAVTANPPYIATGELAGLQAEVRREPMLALDGGPDGLRFYRELPRIAMGLLLPGGLLAMELGDGQGEAAAALAEAAGFRDVTLKKDLFGVERMVFGVAGD